MRPAIISHGAGSGFVSAFIWDGNRDYSPILARAFASPLPPHLCAPCAPAPPRRRSPTPRRALASGVRPRRPRLRLRRAVSTALKFWEAMGWGRARGHMRETLRAGAEVLVRRWGTETLARGPGTALLRPRHAL